MIPTYILCTMRSKLRAMRLALCAMPYAPCTMLSALCALPIQSAIRNPKSAIE